MAVNDIFRCTVVANYTPSGERWIFTLDYRQTGFLSFLSPNAQCIEIASDVFAFTVANYMATVVHMDVTLQKVECFIINDPLFFGQSVQGPVAGSSVGEILPFQTSPLWNKITALRGRNYRGRNFLYPLVETTQDAGVIDAPTIALLQTYGDGLLNRTVVSGDIYDLTVYSATLSTPPGGPFVDNLVSTISINPRLKTRKSRGNT